MRRLAELPLFAGLDDEALREIGGAVTEESVEAGRVVVREGRAYRTRVNLGLIGYDTVEIASGLQKGDDVIVSDMTNYIHARELKLK